MYADELGIILDEYLIEDFSSEETLNKHFRDHGRQVGASTKEEYLKMAEDFIARLREAGPSKSGAPLVGYEGENGLYILFDKQTGEFSSFEPTKRGMTKHPKIRTYYLSNYKQYISNMPYGSRMTPEARFVKEFYWNAKALENEKKAKEAKDAVAAKKAKGAAKYAKKMANRKK